jgi:HAD superfamily hydrolase (TIGR01509 family)
MKHYGVTNSSDFADGIELLKKQQSDVHFFEGVPETLHELKRKGFKLGIVTNTFNSRQEKNSWFKTVGIDNIWDSYADSFELQVTKPDPKIYLAALEPINESPENAAFVGHAKIEIDGAKAIGLTTVIFNPDPDCKEADFKIEKFNDLLKIPPVINSI